MFTNKTFAVAAIFVAALGMLASQTTAIAQTNTKVREASAVKHKIGKAAHHNAARTHNLRVSIPLNAEIVDVIAEFGNEPWGAGESDYGSSAFSATPLNGYKNQSGEWSKGWAKAELVEIGSNELSQFVVVKFSTWKHDNSRRCRLRVLYKKK